ncbi:hypothetical protein AAP_00141 [Ascosphaera apis ARSEF 7405]|uniref:Uncharacterized protein n=1 Tax=Ascosphaera apis ARSEF 7405 TaxID=392613 RepID=A0A166PMU6_9EURO|nr:hypothetical protein AAP_00141 [Ascosphaera apis ARSEF 7405]
MAITVLEIRCWAKADAFGTRPVDIRFVKGGLTTGKMPVMNSKNKSKGTMAKVKVRPGEKTQPKAWYKFQPPIENGQNKEEPQRIGAGVYGKDDQRKRQFDNRADNWEQGGNEQPWNNKGH